MIEKNLVWQRLGGVFFYAAAMGLLEAICVIYLRRLLLPAGASLAPLETPLNHWLPIEIIREICTMVMLVAVAWLAGSNWRSRGMYFFFMFGVWDILYYVGLKWLVGWPSSWLEWDCLFLIPKPWYGPVLAPVLISAYFVVACSALIVSEYREPTWRRRLLGKASQVFAGIIWYWSFVKDTELIQAKGYHVASYSWSLLGLGMATGLIGLWLGIMGRRNATHRTRFTCLISAFCGLFLSSMGWR